MDTQVQTNIWFIAPPSMKKELSQQEQDYLQSHENEIKHIWTQGFKSTYE